MQFTNTLPLKFDSSSIKDIPGGIGIFVDQFLILPGRFFRRFKNACKGFKLLRSRFLQ